MTDRRSQRTKDALRQAMLELLSEHSFAQLSVQQIVDRANVGRSTFYNHFVDKEDLLEENIRALGALIRHQIAESPPGDEHPALAFSRPMLEHIAQVKELFATLQTTQAVQEPFFRMLCALISEGLTESTLQMPEEATVAFLAGGFQALAGWWISQERTRSVEEIHQMVLSLVSPTLQAVQRGASNQPKADPSDERER